MSGFLGASARIQTKSPVLTELLSYQGTDSLDGLPTRQKGNKKRGYPVLTGISSLT